MTRDIRRNLCPFLSISCSTFEPFQLWSVKQTIIIITIIIILFFDDHSVPRERIQRRVAYPIEIALSVAWCFSVHSLRAGYCNYIRGMYSLFTRCSIQLQMKTFWFFPFFLFLFFFQFRSKHAKKLKMIWFWILIISWLKVYFLLRSLALRWEKIILFSLRFEFLQDD